MKEIVILEPLEENKVCVYSYDYDNKLFTGQVIEVCTRQTASKKYNIVGEIYDGEVKLYSEKNKGYDDYTEDFFDEDFEDD